MKTIISKENPFRMVAYTAYIESYYRLLTSKDLLEVIEFVENLTFISSNHYQFTETTYSFQCFIDKDNSCHLELLLDPERDPSEYLIDKKLEVQDEVYQYLKLKVI